VEALVAEPRGAVVHRLFGGVGLGAITVAPELAGVTASACIYRVPSRPAWNTPFTLVQFNLTAATLGRLFAAAVGTGDARWCALTCLRGGERLAYIERIKLPIRPRWREGSLSRSGAAERTSPSNPGRSSASAPARRSANAAHDQ
jgi:DMSO reductase anchor subunit